MLCQVGFEPFGKFTPCKHDTMTTTFTYESDIRAETGDGPFIGAAWMLFAEAQMIVELEVGEHVSPRLRKSF